MGCSVFAFRGSTSIRHEQRDSTDRARRVLRQPQADTARVEGVAAGRQHAELVSLFVFRQTDDAPASLPTEVVQLSSRASETAYHPMVCCPCEFSV